MGNADYKPIETPNIGFSLVVLCLHGQNEIDGRANSYRAYDLFRKYLPDKFAFVHYIDRSGFPVFNLTFFVAGDYLEGFFTSRWGECCDKFNVVAATSYEEIYEYNRLVWGDY